MTFDNSEFLGHIYDKQVMKERISFWIDSDNADFLRSYAHHHGISQGAILNNLVEVLRQNQKESIPNIPKRQNRRIGEKPNQ